MEIQKLENQYAIKATTIPGNWEQIRKKILNRDGNRCLICNKWSAKPDVHHRDANQSNNKPSNLTTICADCHKKLPVPPFSEKFYCKTIVHDWYNPICLRLKEEGLDSQNCQYFSKKHGCVLVILEQ